MKKHSRQEILLKLGQANELARAGKSQVQICKALGVSVMTFHRWRKLSLRRGEVKPTPSLPAEPLTATPSTMAEMRRVLEELTIENRRLRKIVTDLLLEKMKIEEASSTLPLIDTTKPMVANNT
jgi:transposase-like protein